MHAVCVLATGASKATLMAMSIAWQTINAVQRPSTSASAAAFSSSRPV